MKKINLKTFLCILVFFLFGISNASATYMADITFDFMDNGGGNYTFDFNVINTSTNPDTGALDFFEIIFDADADWSLYSNLSWVSDNGWFASEFEYDASFGGLAAAVNADDAADFGGGGGIAQGASLGGFQVNFDYSGSLGPTSQLFSWMANFGTNSDDNGIDTGMGYHILGEDFGTTRYVASAQVPEPTTLLLLGVGLTGLFGFIRRKK